MAAMHGPHRPVPPTTTLAASRWWVARGWWAIDSINASSWASAAKLLELSRADVACVQETKTEEDEAIRGAQNKARGLGWRRVLGGQTHGC